MRMSNAESILNARRHLRSDITRTRVDAEEGGCGVTGFACSIPVSGRHIFTPSVQMHNRGNGKGGGIAAVGLEAERLGVDQSTLDNDFMLQIAFLDEEVLPDLEGSRIKPFFRIDHEAFLETVDDYRDIPGLEIRPPRVKRYFVRVKPDVLNAFQRDQRLLSLSAGEAEEEFIYQNTFHINRTYYSALGEKRAFVLSHGRNMMILKIVGYAEQVAQYYQLENFKAHVWIAHQRYPTKGRVWHPGGAHPFVGMDEALVHNGDFANYYSVSDYLKQRGIYPLFLTDTEVSVQVFDLLNRVYGYPLEYIIESLAPTSEMDFEHLPPEKQHIYRHIQATQMHGSPDGPWFFIIARNLAGQDRFQLIGITDTAMLRPQVFALQKGEFEIGLVCSEKQAIDATLESLHREYPRIGTVADRYWNARGGSYTDGGAFIFTVSGRDGKKELTCSDKFGRSIDLPPGSQPCNFDIPPVSPAIVLRARTGLEARLRTESPEDTFIYLSDAFGSCGYDEVRTSLEAIKEIALSADDDTTDRAIDLLTLLLDRRYPLGTKRRSFIIQMIMSALDDIFLNAPSLDHPREGRFRRLDFGTRSSLRPPVDKSQVLVLDVRAFEPEGDDCHSRVVVEAYRLGWRRFICFGHRGQRFLGCGLGPDTSGVRIDAYGSTGDYLASGMDGMEIRVHGNAQDQLGQILKSGKLVVFGDVGQTFMYGAKGGDVYVMGNAAGRPLINAAGRPRVVINGTALDFLAESFMAGDPFDGGGFVIVNGVAFDNDGRIREQDVPYPGSNLFSLASGGAIFIRDPGRKVTPDQLNGGQFEDFGEKEWQLILPYLQENERLFGISIEDDLLRVNGERREPGDVYRTIGAAKLSVLAGSGAALLANEEWDWEWED